MKKVSRNLTYFVYRKFKIIWMLFTILLFLVFSYVTWNVNVKKSFSLVAEASNKLAHNMDLFLNDIVQDHIKFHYIKRGL